IRCALSIFYLTLSSSEGGRGRERERERRSSGSGSSNKALSLFPPPPSNGDDNDGREWRASAGPSKVFFLSHFLFIFTNYFVAAASSSLSLSLSPSPPSTSPSFPLSLPLLPLPLTFCSFLPPSLSSLLDPSPLSCFPSPSPFSLSLPPCDLGTIKHNVHSFNLFCPHFNGRNLKHIKNEKSRSVQKTKNQLAHRSTLHVVTTLDQFTRACYSAGMDNSDRK